MTGPMTHPVSLPLPDRSSGKAASAAGGIPGAARARLWRSIDDVKERNRHDYNRVPPRGGQVGPDGTRHLC